MGCYQIRRTNILGEDLEITIALYGLSPIPASADYDFEAILTQGSMSANASPTVTDDSGQETLTLNWTHDRLTELFRAGTAVLHVFKHHKTTQSRQSIASGTIVFAGKVCC